ncbi:hypothetical protein CN272_27940 [Bacillus anthracis]|nr:hypothetical protein CN272_27940 [Bacillus anthracis]PFD87207.1 hypothetical protein CN275_20270 [Bacillus anthracis]PFT20060.1 hypothetical protein COK52_22760 [Bacillus thuringiensis]
MLIEFLGTAGGVPTPRVGSYSKVSREACEKGIPYVRTGPGIFIHDVNLLLDTSEDIYYQLRRSKINKVQFGLYSHWHPDHTMGRRIWETLNADFVSQNPNNKKSTIYLPEQVANDFKKFLGIWDHLIFMEDKGFIEICILSNGESVVIEDIKITPFQLAEEFAYGFLLENNKKRVLIVPDEIYGWNPSKYLSGVDIAILPFGHSEFHLIDGTRNYEDQLLTAEHEAKFEDVIEIIKNLNPKKTYITHIEELENISHDDLISIEKQLLDKGLDVSFAYDTLKIDV